MQIAPVHYEGPPAPLDYLVITRAEPAGRVERLRVSRRFVVRVEHRDGRVRNFRLDAAEAEDLIHGLNNWLERAHDLTAPRASKVSFDIELGWGGKTVRLRQLELPEDAAVTGVLNFVNHALDRHENDLHVRRQIPT